MFLKAAILILGQFLKTYNTLKFKWIQALDKLCPFTVLDLLETRWVVPQQYAQFYVRTVTQVFHLKGTLIRFYKNISYGKRITTDWTIFIEYC